MLWGAPFLLQKPKTVKKCNLTFWLLLMVLYFKISQLIILSKNTQFTISN